MKRIHTAAVAAVLALSMLACSSGGDPMGPEPIQAAGTYTATFTATEATGCQGFVEPGQTTGTVTVTQSDGRATLELTEVTGFIQNDPQGSFDPATGAFAFDGTIVVSNEQATVSADGTITGTFTAAGAMDLAFDFTAFTCNVVGTITGQRV